MKMEKISFVLRMWMLNCNAGGIGSIQFPKQIKLMCWDKNYNLGEIFRESGREIYGKTPFLFVKLLFKIV